MEAWVPRRLHGLRNDEPALEAELGDTVDYEAHDAFGGQLDPASTEDLVSLDVVHALAGFVYIKVAEPGDLLEKIPSQSSA